MSGEPMKAQLEHCRSYFFVIAVFLRFFNNACMCFVLFIIAYADEQDMTDILGQGVGIAALFYLLQGSRGFFVQFQLDY